MHSADRPRRMNLHSNTTAADSGLEIPATTARASASQWTRVLNGDLVFFCMAILLLGIGSWSGSGITGLDEYWFSFRTALETQSLPDWWFPQLGGELRLRKPPLLYWLMTGSFHLLGPSFFSARLPALLMGAGLALCMRALSRTLLSGNGTLAGWLTLSIIVVAVESRRAMLDLPVAFTTALAVLLACHALRSEKGHYWYGVALVAACGWMFKGPMIVVFGGAALFAAWLTTNARPSFTTGRWHAQLGAPLLFLTLAVAWPLAVALHAPDFFLDVLRDDAAERQFAWLRLDSFGEVTGALLSVALPWSLLLLAMGWQGLRQRRLPQQPVQRWLLLWLGLALLPFLFIRTFERYLIPLLVPLVLLLQIELERRGQAQQRWPLLSAGALIALPCSVFIALTLWFRLGGLWPWLALCALLFTLHAAWQGRVLRAVQGMAASLCLTLGLVYPALGVNAVPASALAVLNGAPVYHFIGTQPGVLSMYLQRSLRSVDDIVDVSKWLAGYRGYLVLPESEWPRLQTLLPANQLEVVQRFSCFYTRKNVLKFMRADATTADWRAALRSRSLASLQPTFLIVRVIDGMPAAPPGRT